jgi:hypothetical protein
MKFSILKSFLCLALVSAFAYAQEPETATTQVENTSQAHGADSQATVYVYRYKQFVGSALSPSVYCDEIELARMDNGKFLWRNSLLASMSSARMTSKLVSRPT